MSLPTPKAIVEQLIQAKLQGTKVYFMGVEHIGLAQKLFSLDEMIRMVQPDIVLLEARTPESTYQDGAVTGDFVEEMADLSTPRINSIYFQSPNLWEIVAAVDAIDCKVQGMDLADVKKKDLEKSCRLRWRRVARICDSILERSEYLLEETPEQLSDQQYQNLEKVVDALDEIPLASDNGINEVGRHYVALQAILGQYPNLQSFFPKAMKRMKKLGEDISSYLKEREEIMAKIIMEHHDGEQIVLACIGGAHLCPPSNLLPSLDNVGVSYFAFHNYAKET